METKFETLKAEILKRAKEAEACTEQYGRAYKSETIGELLKVVKDNFWWACSHDVLTVDLIELFKDDFAANDIYANQSVSSGYLLCGSATVEACGSATVEAYGIATVEAYDSAYCTSFYTIDCKVSDRAIYRVRSENKIYFADETIQFIRQKADEADSENQPD